MFGQDEATLVSGRPAPSLLGRAETITTIRERLNSGDVRLLTLLGPGGVGKTSLARVIAADIEGETGRRVPFVELAALDDELLITAAIASELGVVSSLTDGLLNAVVAALGPEPSPIVLDNLEQLERASSVVGQLLEASPGLQIIATSRTRLRLPGELVVAVHPLAMPSRSDDDRPPSALRAFPAVALFELSVRQHVPEFELSNRNASQVVEVVRRLEGIPLAIELVSSRARVLSIGDMSARLNELLPLPVNGARNLPERQRTVLASIGWSFDLLPASAQRALGRLSVFPGRFDLAAATAVTEAGIADIDVLVDHQLLRIADHDAPSYRFDMPESVRQFGLEHVRRLGEDTAVRDRHAVWRHALTCDIERACFGPDSSEVLQRHLSTIDDWYQAIEWSIERGENGRAIELFIDFNPHLSNLPWEVAGHWARRIEPMLVDPALDPVIVIRGFIEMGRVAYGAGALETSDQHFTRAAEDARRIGNADLLAIALKGHGATLRGLTEVDRATSLLVELRALSTTVSDPVASYASSIELGAQAMVRGDLESAWNDFQCALSVARRAGAHEQEGNALHFLGYVAAMRGDLETARDAFQRSIRLLANGPDTQRLAALHGLGRTELLAGRIGDAYNALRESLAGRTRRRERLQMRLILTDLALVALSAGRPRLAGEWFGAADLDDSMLSTRRFFADRWIEAVARTRAELGDDAFTRARDRGRLSGLDEAVAAALAFAAPTQLSSDAEQAASAKLSAREVEVLGLLVQGASDRQIAEALFISPLTATRHVKNILRKLGVGTRTAAAMLAVRKGIIRPD